MKTSPRKILLYSLLSLGILTLLIWAFLPEPILVETATVQQGPYEQVVIEEGKTRAKEIYQITSPVSGQLKRVDLHAGDTVQVGDMLAEVDWPKPWLIRSPIAGRIFKIQRESAGPIERGTVIMEVADTADLEIVSEVLTIDAVQIQPEQKVRIKDWGGSKTLQGKIRLIEPKAFTKVSALGIEEQRVNIIIDITSPRDEWQGLADSFRVYNHIITFQTDQALTLPTGALFRDGAYWAVFQVVNDRVQKKQVQLLRRNPEKAMIASGLKAGDVVVVYPSDEIEEGVKVKGMKQKH